MEKNYTRTTGIAQRLRQLSFAALLVSGAAGAAHAQTLGYAASSASNVAGTYTDLGTTGTAIAVANTDDANSAAQDIGFTFSYNGASFTQFVFNTNGVIRLGSAAPSTAALYYDNNSAGTATDPLGSTNAANTNLLMPFNFDLVPGSGVGGADYRVLTSGTAPNRVCTIQWRNVADKAGAGSDAANVTQYANFSFQLKLYETTNLIEFVYGAAVAGSGVAGVRLPQVGLKGSGLNDNQVVLALKGETAAWSATTFQNTNYTTAVHNITKSVLPTAGRTYRFATALPNDVTVTGIYTLGKLATPAALPHAVQAVVTNTGTAAQTNLAVTLNVTGANTFTDTKTVASLAVGASATVTFAAYPSTLATGTNTVTVTVPADDNTANNTATYGQQVTTSRVTYLDPNVTTFGGTVGVGSAGGALVAKYNLPTATTISDVALSFGASSSTSTTYQVVLYSANGTGGIPGTILYTSPTQTRTAAASTPTITIPSVQVPASFYIGVKELDNNPGLNYQTENPLRPAVYYYSLDGATNWTSINNTSLRTRLAIEFGDIAPGCVAPTAVAVSNVTTAGATISFTPAASGSGDYQVVYGPAGFNPGTGGTTVTATTSPVVLTGLTTATTYQVYVRGNCTGGGNSLFTPAVSFTTACDPTAAVTAFPYNQNFDTILSGQTLPCGFTTLDANTDGTTWRTSTDNPYSGTNSIRYNGLLVNDRAADDWFFTPALTLPATTANTRYQVAFRYRVSGVGSGTSSYTESLEVKSGTAATVAGQTNLLYTNNAINNLTYAQAGGATTPAVAYLPAGASTQYVGFHIKSAANQGNLYIDDLSVTAVIVTATSEALLRAVAVYPNPSTTGLFDLAINGANARQGLQVEVVNNVGQVVYTGSARDNFTNKLDLSHLNTGLYHLKVVNGDEYLLRQLSIIK